MLTHRHILQSVRPGDWFTTVDLWDAYIHVPIRPEHRKHLRVRVCCAAIRALPSSAYVFKVCGHYPGSPAAAGDQSNKLMTG